jgi:mono/diheme cytochrome c family protein
LIERNDTLSFIGWSIVMKLIRLFPGFLAILAVAAPLAAQDAVEDGALPPGTKPYPLVEQGADLARIWCSACHVTGAGPTENGMDAAPPFASLAPMVAASPDHYRTFLTRPHGSMKSISLSREEIDALLAFIEAQGE